MPATAMKSFAFLASLLAIGPALATEGATPSVLDRWEADRATVFTASEVDLESFRWLARPVIVFADSESDPAFQTQLELLSADLEALGERDIILITDTNPEAFSDLRRKLRPRGFMLTLIGKDGGVKLRKPFPWDVRELSRQIDKMPMRRQEILDAKAEAAAGE